MGIITCPSAEVIYHLKASSGIAPCCPDTCELTTLPIADRTFNGVFELRLALNTE
jgi:hypothetical protein